ncbi:MAG: hypothetical protein IIA85_02540 [Nanoarchaeota archaeon]|nr:hypothetical protein [Nanoarchaeota archaeon]
MNLKKIIRETSNFFIVLSTAATLSCSPMRIPNKELSRYECNSENSINSGKLYFYEHSKTSLDLMHIINKVQDNFCEIGIKFHKAEVFRRGEFPSLDDIDILILVDEEYPDKNFRGGFGIEFKNYLTMKPRIGFNYNQKTAKTNVGFIYPKIIFQDIGREISRRLSDSEKLKLIVQLSTHEVAHGFGASHVQPIYSIPSFPQPYFMGTQTLDNKQSFLPRNVSKMKKFINETKTRKMGQEDIIKLREDYISKKDLMRD